MYINATFSYSSLLLPFFLFFYVYYYNNYYTSRPYSVVTKCVSVLPKQLPEMRLRHQRRLAVAVTAMVVVSAVTWLPLGIAPLAMMMARAGRDVDGDGGTEGRWLLLVAVVALSSVVSAPLMHVANGRNFRRNAVALLFCHRQKVGTAELSAV